MFCGGVEKIINENTFIVKDNKCLEIRGEINEKKYLHVYSKERKDEK